MLGAASAGTVDSFTAISPQTPGQTRLIIVVAATAYRDTLLPWIESRQAQGFDVRWVEPERLLGTFEGEVAVSRLREEIARQVGKEVASREPGDSEPAAFVLLVGDAPGPAERLDLSRLIPA